MVHRRSILLINKRFQVRFAFYVCSWLFALSLVYPSIIYSLFDYFFRYVAHDPNSPGLERLKSVRQDLLFWLVVLHLVFMLITFLVSIFISHRIAGPLYKLRMKMDQAKEGDRGELQFRKFDHFPELAESYNGLLSQFKDGASGVSAPNQKGSGHQDLEKAITLALTQVDAPTKLALEQSLQSLKSIRENR